MSQTVKNQGKIYPPEIRADIRDIATPKLVKTERRKITLQTIFRKHPVALARFVRLELLDGNRVLAVFSHYAPEFVLVYVNGASLNTPGVICK